jgi:cyclophilin family peptidyl-prolyl cis-trans isomerase
MIHRFLALALSLPLLAAIPAAAQDAPVQEGGTLEDAIAEPAEAVTRSPMPITANFDATQDLENILYLDLSNGRRVAIRLVPQWAPEHVERIKTLTRQGFYDGVIFHRVIEGFMAQTGDPTGTGTGGSELPDLKEEFNRFPHVRGSVSMARAQSEDSANSQFFIVFYPRFSLDRNYTNFGRVIAGMDAVDAIQRGEPPQNPTYIVQASIAADNKPQKMPPAAPAAGANITAAELNNSASN